MLSQSPFAVLHSETREQVAVDMDYHWAMYELHHKANLKEVIVGWCIIDRYDFEKSDLELGIQLDQTSTHTLH
ncbi:hypothetical protein GGU10DRAFT_58427 [Lentinula aff. detonsa]|uniref:JAB1/MPN/MOV34 metalloenzyme domain-containing protein n=1 Tax=Lentinula aff. detonsa TaxID=2804958 RepID=A0AA38KD96_9AGAR|nr:hypothetical protein GGU10DRAFT_58427 [Lentinula aff. detonsa]